MKRVLYFALGAAAGSLITWKLVEEKYKKIADEEVASVVEQFKLREKEQEKEFTMTSTEYPDGRIVNESTHYIPHKFSKYPWGSEEQKKYEEQVEDYTADMSDKIEETIKVNLPKEYTRPYVISPDEFGEFGNDTKSLTYYADGILADDDDEIVSEPEYVVGDALEHFGEYEDDAVHVRDENLECDYEILKSEKTFDEIMKGDN